MCRSETITIPRCRSCDFLPTKMCFLGKLHPQIELYSLEIFRAAFLLIKFSFSPQGKHRGVVTSLMCLEVLK